jgi:hypothetical protein
VQKGFGRAHTKKADPLGPLVAELQDHVEDMRLGPRHRRATVAANILTIAQSCVIALPVSFETGEQLTHTLYFPKGATVTRLRALVTKALANTDAGTIQGKNDGGTNMTTGLITIPLSSALATEVTVTPTGKQHVHRRPEGPVCRLEDDRGREGHPVCRVHRAHGLTTSPPPRAAIPPLTH